MLDIGTRVFDSVFRAEGTITGVTIDDLGILFTVQFDGDNFTREVPPQYISAI